MIDEFRCPICKRIMLLIKGTFLCPICDIQVIFDINTPNTNAEEKEWVDKNLGVGKNEKS